MVEIFVMIKKFGLDATLPLLLLSLLLLHIESTFELIMWGKSKMR
jgi:hypothetical protein